METTKNGFVAYEYKNLTVRRDSVALYRDCLQNFGWTQVEDRERGYGSDFIFNPVGFATSLAGYASHMQADSAGDPDMVTLKLKRDRGLANKSELDRLERECEQALAAIHKKEKNNNATTTGISIGTGIVGTGALALAAYNFMNGNTVLGVIFSVIGAAGWAIGFFSNLRLGKKKASQSEPFVQQQLDVVYNSCEQAYALLV